MGLMCVCFFLPQNGTTKTHDIPLILQDVAGADFFELGGKNSDELRDDDLLGGALEPEGEETAEENGRTNYLLEEEIHPDDMYESEYRDGDRVESNGHDISSKLNEQLNLKHKVLCTLHQSILTPSSKDLSGKSY